MSLEKEVDIELFELPGALLRKGVFVPAHHALDNAIFLQDKYVVQRGGVVLIGQGQIQHLHFPKGDEVVLKNRPVCHSLCKNQNLGNA